MKDIRGTTLIETLLTVAISSLILMSVVFFFIIFLEARAKTRAFAEVEQQGVHVLEVMSATIRDAESITSPSMGTSAASATLDVFDTGSDPTVFDMSSDTIRMTEGVGSAIALTSPSVAASGLSFSNYSRSGTPGTLRIQFTLTYLSASGRHEYTYAKTFIGSASLR